MKDNPFIDKASKGVQQRENETGDQYQQLPQPYDLASQVPKCLKIITLVYSEQVFSHTEREYFRPNQGGLLLDSQQSEDAL